MDYDFETPTQRFQTYSLKWNVKDNELPMWVADMDFETAPQIVEAIVKKAQKGIFGYIKIDDEYYQSIINWWANYHKLKLKQEWLLFVSGVIPAISSIIRSLTKIGDKILIQPPVYGTFYKCIINNQRKVVENPLIYENYQYRIDFNDLEKKLRNSKTSLMILCNPHNPIGKIWSKDDLEQIAFLCKKYGVIVISDEIHCDITSKPFIPFASVALEDSITAISASKTFNLASIHAACVFIKDKELRHKIASNFKADEIADATAFSIEACIAAFGKSRKWLENLNEYIQANKDYATNFIETHLNLKVVRGEATYLLWVDCSSFCDDTQDFCQFLREKTGLFISKGKDFGENGKAFVRINIATQMVRLKDGLQRFEKGILEFKKINHKK